ncbi:protein regulator of cytokinesis 1-like [Sycon ciliatum]|uniref:protein regulator of cytokinesis 1-like n=1 Tax=Sycon ciliatum TaxID=27933 RepID=UPI0020AA947C|eukprot:scpid55672/ scgid32117/ Protein regulator of cytokinesis 1
MEVPNPSGPRAELQATLHDCIDKSLKQLSTIWHDIGLSENQQCDRTKVVLEHVQGLLEDMSTEEEECRSKLKENVKTLRDEYKQLCLQLSVSETQLDSDLTLLRCDEELRKLTTDQRKEKSRRVQQMKSLLQEEEDLSAALCRSSQLAGISQEQVPTLKQLQSWSDVVSEARQDKESRVEKLRSLQHAVQSLWLQLDTNPSNSPGSPGSLEFLLNTDNGIEKMQLTDQTEQSVKAIVSKLEDELVTMVTRANSLRSQISSLYSRLDVAEEEQEAFLSQNQDCRRPTVVALETEHARLEELKRVHMNVFIERVRCELAELWDRCLFGSQQREQFAPAFSNDEATEELLSAHEVEAERLKQYLADTAPIYDLVSKREGLWTRMKDLLASANNPNRYANRGGQLLKEEKARKAVSKELPRVEKEMQQAIEAFENESKQIFTLRDERYLDTVSEQWESLQTKKEQDKTKRTQKGKEDVPPAIAITPHKRRPATTPSSNHPAKRKVIATPSASASRNPQPTLSQSKTPLRRQVAGSQSARKAGVSAAGKPMRTPLQERNNPEASMALAGNINDVADCTIGSIAAINYKEFEETVSHQARCSSMGRPNELPVLNLKS